MVQVPDNVLQAILSSEGPCFVYDRAALRERSRAAAALVEKMFFPIKACPEAEVVRAALETGCGVDLCSEGDVDIARAVGCPGPGWKYTSPQANEALLRGLVAAGARLDADSVEQALCWKRCGGTACGLRVTARNPKSLYGAKFGISAREIAGAARRLTAAGLSLEGLHLHDQHCNLTPAEFALRLAEDFGAVERAVLADCRYLNLGGSWPMRHCVPATAESMRGALGQLRQTLAELGFKGALYAEPGRWIAGPCGYWAARVVALKPHPRGPGHSVVVLDTSTPVPCKPSVAPFVVVRNGAIVKARLSLACDLFGSANTALDSIGVEVHLPPLELGDRLVSLGQGAYTRALIPPFNERPRPAALVVGT